MDNRDVVAHIKGAHADILAEVRKVIVGQEEVIEQIIISILAGGHTLLLGVPGLGKTLLVKTIAQIFDLDFSRIQFTPDLMPADIFGSELVEEDPVTGKRSFRFCEGPIFANIVLADELNRTPPKTQSALLEAMGEGQVTAGGQTRVLPKPFFVLATQNPIELEGTYPIPEASLDRFLLNVVLDYLPMADEEAMVAATTSPQHAQVKAVFSSAEVEKMQSLVKEVAISSEVINYVVRLITATRPGSDLAPEFIKKNIKWGAGSRASQALVITAKARAILYGRYHVSVEDIQALALPVLRHRIITSFHAEADNITADQLIQQLLDTVKF
jgi:MoxR-like ATPase